MLKTRIVLFVLSGFSMYFGQVMLANGLLIVTFYLTLIYLSQTLGSDFKQSLISNIIPFIMCLIVAIMAKHVTFSNFTIVYQLFLLYTVGITLETYKLKWESRKHD